MTEHLFTLKVDLARQGLIKVEDLEKAKKIMCELHSALWINGYYDPYSEDIGKFSRPLSDKMSELNKIFKFKK